MAPPLGKVRLNSPAQLSLAEPDPVYPLRHSHWNEPGIFLQSDMVLHDPGHSLISENRNKHSPREEEKLQSNLVGVHKESEHPVTENLVYLFPRLVIYLICIA